MHRTPTLALALIIAVTGSAVEARAFAGPRGGSGSASYAVQGNRFSAEASGTTAAGKTASATASGAYHPATDTIDGAASVTGPQGVTHGGTAVATGGTATVTSDAGASRTFTSPR